MSFAKMLNEIGNSPEVTQEQEKSAKSKEDKKKAFLEKQEARLDELMTSLTAKYAKSTYESIIRAAKKGYKSKYINFSRDDFKANFPGLGTPKEVERKWLNEMMNPDSKYLVEDDEGNKICLEGIDSDIWNNGAFTTHFSWIYS